MNLSSLTANHFRAVFFGGNWTVANVQDLLSDVTLNEATTKIDDLNTIYALVFHIHYFVAAVLKVFQGEALTAKDAYSFEHPELHSEADWNAFVKQVLTDAEQFAEAVENLPETVFNETFIDVKYGNYYRNIHGIIEHSHYHLGQISLVKKLIRNGIR